MNNILATFKYNGKATIYTLANKQINEDKPK